MDHGTLLSCLRKHGIPPEIVYLLGYWFDNQQMCARWGNTTSKWFGVKRGVRQGGCLSPTLFNVLLYDAIEAIRNTQVGCSIGDSRINIIAYADDLLLMAPSILGLQLLVDKCCSLLNDLCLYINGRKSACIAFEPTGLK